MINRAQRATCFYRFLTIFFPSGGIFTNGTRYHPARGQGTVLQREKGTFLGSY